MSEYLKTFAVIVDVITQKGQIQATYSQEILHDVIILQGPQGPIHIYELLFFLFISRYSSSVRVTENVIIIMLIEV